MDLLSDMLGHRAEGLIAAATGATPEVAAPEATPPTRTRAAIGDLVRWNDGTLGAIKQTHGTWFGAGETLVYRHHDRTGLAAPLVLIEAGTLTAASEHAGIVTFTYTGSLR